VSITAADHKTSSDKHGAFVFGETNSNCVKRPRSGGCKSVVKDSASSCMNCSTDDFARCCDDHCCAPGGRLAVADRAQTLCARATEPKVALCKAQNCPVTCWQHVISRCYDSLKRSSGEWKEACTFSSGAWSGAPALHLRAQCTYQEKSEHEHRRTRHKRRALSTGQRTETRTTARPTNKQHTNDWSSAFFRQFRRFAPILEPSLHGARGLTSFIHHASDALRALCSQMGTTSG